MLVAIVKKQLKIALPLYTFLQILSLSVFDQVHILQLVRNPIYRNNEGHVFKQLNLSDL